MSRLETSLLRALLAAAVALASSAPRAEESYASLSLQNDYLLGNDGGGYTSGIFASKLRVASPGEGGVSPFWLFGPVATWLGLPQPTLTSAMLGQIIVTPADITRAVPDPNDAPYLGALMFRAAQVYVRGDVADMFALELGMIGPASGAAQTQRGVHRLTGSKAPQGWDTQVPNRLLVSLDAYRARRFAFGGGAAETAPADLVVLGGGNLGSLKSSVGGSVLLRYGTGLERSLPTTVRVSGNTGDPFVVGRGWFVFGGFSADRLFRHAGVGNSAPGNTAELKKTRLAAKVGAAYGGARSSITFSLESASPLVEASNKRQQYGAITYSYLLD
ncbi:MAG: lipid A deacylase LpxR family protein [Rhizobiales bacterium]|nr:lipid A deacylase LpxR family protein [Rhizobacter sp.]